MRALCLVVLLATACASRAPAPTSATAERLQREVPVARGATKADVEAAYAGEKLTRVAPATLKMPANAPQSALPKRELPAQHESWRYRERGVWFFFDADDRVATIRLDPPFAGEVGGVRLGETHGSLTYKRGTPTKQFAFGDDTAVVYGDVTTADWARYDIAPSGVVVRMFR